MSYQVLARKYRPKTFAEMVGQQHVLRALINALDTDRLHHAYLFTGTRGVGKTTLARLLAKCLNCEVAVSSIPCEVCVACTEINAGHFIDLIEVDAASRTKVEDTRELLDNVQYAPARGRFKIYLIDEVHMLSTHSFNALLKTLEEPPAHIKFLLATTDPQRLPVTVLSRCLQFNLKNLTAEKIGAQLEYVLQQEQINYEVAALQQLARAADGSMRDALSLLDQAIPHGDGQITVTHVHAMLGTIEQQYVVALLQALVAQDAAKLIAQVEQLVELGADFAEVLAELISALHQLALAKILPATAVNATEHAIMSAELAAQLPAETIQLFYQIGLTGRRDLPLAPSPRIGFEMTLLRMLAFSTPEVHATVKVLPAATQPLVANKPTANNLTPATAASVTSSAPAQLAPVPSAQSYKLESSADWMQLIPALKLNGFTQALALNCKFCSFNADVLSLELDPSQAALRNPKQEARLAETLTTFFAKLIKLKITAGQPDTHTPARQQQQQRSAQLESAAEIINTDPHVQALIKTFNATIVPNSIQATNPAMLHAAVKNPLN